MPFSISIHKTSKIASRIIIIFICCTAIPITILSFLCYRHVTTHLYLQDNRQLRQTTKAIGMAIYERLLFIEADLKTIETNFRKYSNSDYRQIKVKLLENYKKKRYKSIAIQQKNGQQTIIWGKVDQLPKMSKAQLKQFKNEKSIIITQPGSDTKAQIFMIRKFQSEQPTTYFLFLEIDVAYLWGIGHMNTLPPMVELSVIDSHQNILISSVPNSKILAKKLQHAKWSLSDGIEWVTNETTYLVCPWVLFLKSNFLSDIWTIVLIKSKNDIFAPIANFQKIFLLIMLMTMLMVMLLSIFQIRKSLIPIEALKEGTLRIAKGNLEKKVKISSNDEFEDLATSFNTMANQLDRQFKMLNVSADIDKAILSSLKTENIIDTIITRMDEVFSCSKVILFLKESKRSHTYLAHMENRKKSTKIDKIIVELSLPEVELFIAYPDYLVFYINDNVPNFLSQFIDHEIKGFIVLPILIESKLAGLITAGYNHSDELNMRELFQHRQLADQVAVALSNAKLVEDLKQLNLGTLTALARTVDAKSPWTAGHSERVTSYSIQVGKVMALSSMELEALQRAALLHDIGKIGVSAEILDKTEKLTDQEYTKIQNHSRIGARILEPIGAYAEVIPIVLQHHERFDGKGYPYGLFGESISISARIISVCDVFDALASDRPYRKAMKREIVIEMIKKNAGTQFDPNVVDAFLKVI